MMKELKDQLTNQILTDRYPNNFELLQHAIDVAKQMLGSERRCRVPTEVKNRAYQVLLEIVEGKDDLEASPNDLPEIEIIHAEPIEALKPGE